MTAKPVFPGMAKFLLPLLRAAHYRNGVESLQSYESWFDAEAAWQGHAANPGAEGEIDPAGASKDEALYWRHIYRETSGAAENLLAALNSMNTTLPESVLREVVVSQMPVIEAHAARCRDRLGYWEARVRELR